MSISNPIEIPKVCIYPECKSHLNGKASCPEPGSIVRHAYFLRKSDGQKSVRFLCNHCGRTFSTASLLPEVNQKKRQLNSQVFNYLGSGVSLNRISLLLQINRKTVVKKFLFTAAQAKVGQDAKIVDMIEKGEKIDMIQFDEMESSIHTKCLPVSMPIVVAAQSRFILGIGVAQMPAKGKLAKISVKKYGHRKDERKEAAEKLLSNLKGIIAENVNVLSDKNPNYPKWISSQFPNASHSVVKGVRGAITGQGELKKKRFDPMFSFNHTAAMYRANVNRLFRRTWNTSKRMDRLLAHMTLYMHFHNTVLLPKNVTIN